MNGFDIKINYSEKAKGTTIEVWPGNVVNILAPLCATETELQKLVSQKTKWIIEKQRLIKDIPAWRQREFVSGESFPLLGKDLRLKIFEGVGEAFIKDDRIYVPLSGCDLEHEDIAEIVKLQLIRWYKKIAFEKILDRTDYYFEKLDVKANSI